MVYKIMLTAKEKRWNVMYSEKDLLLQSAARLYSLGVDVEGAREELRRLVALGVPYESPEMYDALKNFLELDAQWKELERQHLKLQAEIKKVPPKTGRTRACERYFFK